MIPVLSFRYNYIKLIASISNMLIINFPSSPSSFNTDHLRVYANNLVKKYYFKRTQPFDNFQFVDLQSISADKYMVNLKIKLNFLLVMLHVE